VSGTRSRPSRRAAAWLPLLALLACGDGDPVDSGGPPSPSRGPAPAGLVLRPGDSLFDHLEAVKVAAHPPSSLPRAAADRLAELQRQGRHVIDAGDWIPGETRLDGAALATILSTEGPVRRWWVRPSLRLDLALGPLWFRHEGRALRPLFERGAESAETPEEPCWLDDVGPRLLCWDAAKGALVAFGDRPPGEVECGYQVRGRSAVGRAEWRLAEGAKRPADARPLRCRGTLDRTDRDCLLAPAPTSLVVEIDALGGESLELAVGVLDLAFVLDDRELKRVRGRGDGATFVVEVERDGVTEELLAHHVPAGGGFDELSVDLSAYRGRAVKLWLRTLPGAADDPRFDYALWSGLRLDGRSPRTPERPHVVLIDVDTLRADRLGTYGHDRPTSPRLDAWARAEAVVYTDATAVNNWTLPSTVSMLTGLDVPQHGVSTFGRVLDESVPSVARLLREAGYETYARSDGGFVAPLFGFGDGFDIFDSRRSSWRKHQRLGWREELKRLRGRRSERPVFYFLQTYQVHAPFRDDRRFVDPERPYEGPIGTEELPLEGLMKKVRTGVVELDDEDWRFLDAFYDAGVRRMDDVVMDFVDGLEEAFAGEDYVVLFTSDHGEELAERGRIGHGHSLHREVLAVPLIVRHPSGRPRGRDAHPTSTLDVVPTILTYAGLAVPEHMPGRSLSLPLPPRRLRVAHHDTTAQAILFDGWKLLVGEISAFGTTERLGHLYRLDGDPWERTDVADEWPETMERLSGLERQYAGDYGPRSAAAAGEEALDPALLDDLQALGYLGGR